MDEPAAARPVPVLLITGVVGAGKTTVTAEASSLLRQAGIPHAVVDLAVIGGCWPTPPDDQWNEGLIHRNLACMWANFQRAGASRLLVCRVLEARSLLTRITEAVPGAIITVVRLRAPLEVVRARIRAREAGRDPQWYLEVAEYLTPRLEDAHVEDHVVDNHERPAEQAAAEVLRVAGWLPAG
jgi:dephospho-CoA kinase